MTSLLLPVGERRMSSWEAHQKRVPRSTEPGTDWYCPIGTTVIAPADGRVYGYGTSIQPATGRWVGLEFENGMSFRAMHFSRILLSSSVLNNRGFVRAGQEIALSGASGYGEEDWSWNPNTGGAHTHGTLWPTYDRRFGYRPNGKPYTIDFMQYASGSPAGGGGNTPTPEPVWRKNSMSTIYRKQEGSTFTYALAGDSPGTSANWLETTDGDLAKQWGEVHGRSVFLNPNTSWKTYKAAYLEALRTR